MGRRYLRTFRCVDCGEMVTRMWQARRAKVCLPCGKRRFEVATTAAVEATAAHTRACRERLAALALERAS